MKRLIGPGILLLCFCAVLVAGCGTCKEDLERAKRKIAAMTAEKQDLTAHVTRLESKKTELTEETTKLSKSNLSLSQDTARLKRSQSALRDEMAALKRKNEEAAREASKLKGENAELKKKIEKLEKQVADLSKPPPKRVVPEPMKPSPGKGELKPTGEKPGAKPGLDRPMAKTTAGATPCDAVIQFMHKCSAAVRQLRGPERTKRVAAIRKEYAEKMKGAPATAVKQAEAWVAELSKGWDKSGGDIVFQLLVKRNAVLKACQKTASEAGF
jgi:cell division protein FtsB